MTINSAVELTSMLTSAQVTPAMDISASVDRTENAVPPVVVLDAEVARVLIVMVELREVTPPLKVSFLHPVRSMDICPGHWNYSKHAPRIWREARDSPCPLDSSLPT